VIVGEASPEQTEDMSVPVGRVQKLVGKLEKSGKAVKSNHLLKNVLFLQP